MKQFVVYWVWPNPAGWHYGDPKITAFIVASALLVALSFVLRSWRGRQMNPQTRNLSKSWSSAAFWFGVVALFLIVCRVEMIQFLAMRLLWVVWAIGALLYIVFQVLQFRRRHYTIVGRTQVFDERDKYLPRKK